MNIFYLIFGFNVFASLLKNSSCIENEQDKKELQCQNVMEKYFFKRITGHKKVLAQKLSQELLGKMK